VEGRQALGHGWVSHVLQRLVAALWTDRAVQARLRAATQTYAARRLALLDALSRQGVEAHGRSGLNVWVPVAEEVATLSRLAAAGWAARAGERYRVKSRPAIRLTISTLREDEVEALAADVAAAVHPALRARSA
jgi:DNA-binding transcriptional MocR family regulator